MYGVSVYNSLTGEVVHQEVTDDPEGVREDWTTWYVEIDVALVADPS